MKYCFMASNNMSYFHKVPKLNFQNYTAKGRCSSADQNWHNLKKLSKNEVSNMMGQMLSKNKGATCCYFCFL